MVKWILKCFLLLFAQTGFCQFTDSTHYMVQYSSTGSINRTDESKAYLLNNALKLGIRKQSISLNFSNNWIYGKQNRQLTNNDFSSTLDFNLYHAQSKFFYWGLANYNTSVSLKINNQLLAGVGIAYNFLDKETAYLNISNGLLFDTSDLISPDGFRDQYETIRNSLRVSFKFVLFQNLILSNTSFLQNALTTKGDYVLKTDAALNFKINKWLGLNTSYKYNRVSRTERENSLLSYGLTFERYF
ncbi:DUF481 domain-containing protein [Pedobacter sp. MC2016-24]|nr:DUF481 domain-containing protein [Pedobacter sp. MC2016-24]